MDRKSVIFHLDSLVILEKMTDEQAGQFIKLAYQFLVTGVMPECDFSMQMALTPFVNQWTRDAEKWESVRLKRAEAGRLGGVVANANKRQQSVAKGGKRKQKTPVSVNGNVNGSVSVSKNENIKLPFSSDAFASAWKDLIEQPKWKNKTDKALITCLEQLAWKSEKVAIAMIKKSIANNWQGLFDLKPQEIAEVERKPLYVSQIKNDDY